MDKVQFGISGACGAAAYGALISGLTPAGLLTGFGLGTASKALAHLINKYLFCRGPVEKVFSNNIELEHKDGDNISMSTRENMITKEVKLLIAHQVGCGAIIALATKIGLATGALFSLPAVLISGLALYTLPKVVNLVGRGLEAGGKGNSGKPVSVYTSA